MLNKTLLEWPTRQSSSIDRLYLALAETSPDALMLVAPDGKICLGTLTRQSCTASTVRKTCSTLNSRAS